MHLSEMSVQQKAVITKLNDTAVALKLLEMGCVPGQEISIAYKAPLGDPIAVKIDDYLLALRQTEAKSIEVALIN